MAESANDRIDDIVMPPLASSNTWGKSALRRDMSCNRTGSKLSSMMMSAPAVAAAWASSQSRTSTSTFIVCGAKAFASLTSPASVLVPLNAHKWLSLIITELDRPMRWVLPPPTSTPYFSTSPNPAWSSSWWPISLPTANDLLHLPRLGGKCRSIWRASLGKALPLQEPVGGALDGGDEAAVLLRSIEEVALLVCPGDGAT